MDQPQRAPKYAAEEKSTAAATGTERVTVPEAGAGAGASAAATTPTRDAATTPAIAKKARALDLKDSIASMVCFLLKSLRSVRYGKRKAKKSEKRR